MSSNDDYWTAYERALDEAATTTTVTDLFAVLRKYFPPSSGDAFFPNGGDRDLLGTLADADHFQLVWSKADYWFAMRESGGDGFTFTEGDLDRGTDYPRL